MKIIQKAEKSKYSAEQQNNLPQKWNQAIINL